MLRVLLHLSSSLLPSLTMTTLMMVATMSAVQALSLALPPASHPSPHPSPLPVQIPVQPPFPWSSRDSDHSHYHRNKADLANTTVTTRLGNNLCRVCSHNLYSCNFNITTRCPDSIHTNSSIVWPHSGDGTKLHGHDVSDDKSSSDVTLMPTQPGQRPTWHGRGWGRRWGRWNNHPNNWGDTPTLVPSNSTLGGATQALCTYSIAKTCSSQTCNITCCDGSTLDPVTNACHKEIDQEGCKNGGTRKGGYCYCSKGFYGRFCEQRYCSLVCQNGGVCRMNMSEGEESGETPESLDHCVCPEDTSGTFCEKKVCTLDCKNNGTCDQISKYSHACTCPDGFYGTLCENEYKPGECQTPNEPVICGFHGRSYEFHPGIYCSQDRDCPGNKKCCRMACRGNVCDDPYFPKSVCTYNNETHQLGTVFTPDPCRVCTCNASHVGHLQGVVECTRTVCPEVPKYCSNVTIPHGDCCPVCTDDPNVAMCAGNYTYPRFLNCPDDLVVLDVDPGSDLALVDIGLVAQDCKGDSLTIYLADQYLMAGIGEQNFQLTAATTARDGKGNFAECVFHVRIRDPYPPEFVTCPTDFTEPSPGPVTWEIPVARDNVGLAIPPTSRRHPGNQLTPGEYLIEYRAEDYQGNVAHCSFVVTVGDYKKDNSHSGAQTGGKGGGVGGTGSLPYNHGQPHPHPHPHPQPPALPQSHAAISIGIGVTTSLLVIGLLGLAFFFYRRGKRSHRTTVRSAGGASSPTDAAAGGLGWSRGHCPPQYSLPPDDVLSPPSYSRSDDVMGSACGGREEAGELPSKSPFA